MIQSHELTAAIAAAMAIDPRAANCRAFAYDAAGKVIGIRLVHVPFPTASYELVSAQLVDEYAAQGNTVVTVSVLTEDGIPTAERCFLAWPFPGLDAEDSPAGPGNVKNEFAATSKFPSSSIGPLAFYVGDAAGNPISDIIGGYGLPDGHHISGQVVFRERTTTPDEPDEPDTGADPLERIAAAIERLAAHLGA